MSKKIKESQTYRESLQGDVLKRYDEKIACIGTDPYVIPSNELDSDRSKWPEVCYVDVVNFLIFQKSSYTKEQLRNFKSLEAYKMFQDGWVKELLHKDFGGVHLFRGKVYHSMRIREKPLQPWVLVSPEGTIEAAHCTCMAGLGECCSHAAAILFALETAARLRGEATVTDTSAYWKYPSAACFDQPFQKIRDMDFQSAAKKRKLSMSNETTQQEALTMNGVSSPTKKEIDNFFRKLKEVMPTACVLSLHKDFCASFEPKRASVIWPVNLNSFYNESLTDKDYDEVLNHCDNINVEVSAEQVKMVEETTRKQCDSEKWHSARLGRVTASNFHAATHTDTNNPSKSILAAICKPTLKVSTKATEWGKTKETAARRSYIEIMQTQHMNFTCRESGLYLNSSYPQFGASPDGIVSCDCCGTGCIEVKCPYSLKDSDTQPKFIVENADGMGLDRKHTYYTQVQTQIFMTNSDFCDFIVWTPQKITIERIKPDKEFWMHASELAKKFHRLCVMPELCANFFSSRRVLSSVTVEVVKENERLKYCVCEGDDDGRKMIACDSENCKYVWFHLVCIKMKRVPKGGWTCRFCRK